MVQVVEDPASTVRLNGQTPCISCRKLLLETHSRAYNRCTTWFHPSLLPGLELPQILRYSKSGFLMSTWLSMLFDAILNHARKPHHCSDKRSTRYCRRCVQSSVTAFACSRTRKPVMIVHIHVLCTPPPECNVSATTRSIPSSRAVTMSM